MLIKKTLTHFIKLKKLVWMDGWMDGRMNGKAILRIAYSNRKLIIIAQIQELEPQRLLEDNMWDEFQKRVKI